MAPQRRSIVHKYFNVTQGSRKATCTLCNIAIQCYIGAEFHTANMMRHLRNNHPSILGNKSITPSEQSIFPTTFPNSEISMSPILTGLPMNDVSVQNDEMDKEKDTEDESEDDVSDCSSLGESRWGFVGNEENDDINVSVEDDEMDEDTEADESNVTSDAKDDESDDDDVSENSETHEENEK